MSQPISGTGLTDLDLAVIDQRIRAAAITDRAVGTVVDVIDALHVTATMDPATTAVPVKVAGHVQPRPQDRVLMLYFGPPRQGEWWIVAALAVRRLASANVQSTLGSGTTSSSSYSDLPGTPGFEWTKRNDDSTLRLQMAVTAYVVGSSGNAVARYGMAFIPDVGSTVIYDVALQIYNFNSVYFNAVGFDRFEGLPAGTYTVVGQWKRNSGTGDMTVDGNCAISMEATEEWIEVTV